MSEPKSDAPLRLVFKNGEGSVYVDKKELRDLHNRALIMESELLTFRRRLLAILGETDVD